MSKQTCTDNRIIPTFKQTELLESCASSSSVGKAEYDFDPENYTHGQDQSKRSSGLVLTCANFINTILGAGVLGLPWTISECGWLVGTILVVGGAIATQAGLFVLSNVCMCLGGDQLSWRYVSYKAHRFMPLFASVLVWSYALLIACLYIGTAANFFLDSARFFVSPETSPNSVVLNRTFWLTLPFLLIGAPLSFPRKMGILGYTSIAAVVAVLYTTGVVIFHRTQGVDVVCKTFLSKHKITDCFGDMCCVSDAPGAACCIGKISALPTNFDQTLTAIPGMITAFACATSLIPLYNDLKRPSVKRLAASSSAAITIVIVLYLVVALAGYTTYGSQVSSDLLSAYPLSSEVTVARIAMGFVLTTSTPLLMQPARDAFIDIVKEITTLITGVEYSFTGDRVAIIMYYSCLVFNLIIAYFVAWLNFDFSVLLKLVGGVGAVGTSFVLPGMIGVMLLKNSSTVLKVTCWSLIVLGVGLQIINFVLWGKNGL